MFMSKHLDKHGDGKKGGDGGGGEGVKPSPLNRYIYTL